jgi:mono/diheme cytochrome c family protein
MRVRGTMTWNLRLARRLAGGAHRSTLESSRMRSGQSPIRFLLLAAGLATFCGCSGDRYDDSIEYPVRTDFIVNEPNAPWGDIAPSVFYRPGMLPLDSLRLPDNEQSPDAVKLKALIGKKILDPTTIPAADRTEYGKLLKDMFGTPAHPKVSGINISLIEGQTVQGITEKLKLDDESLSEGSKHYRMHCLHCHGLEGNGRGPTGPWLNPPPRDYRTGIFKYVSSNQPQNSRKPRRDDILHVLAFGIEGTSMPSFNVLSLKEREQIASYVIHLSLRGEAEYTTMMGQLKLAAEASKGQESANRFYSPKAEGPVDKLKDVLEENLAGSLALWVAAQEEDAKIKPTDDPVGSADDKFMQSAARGGKIFVGSCISCHQNYGRESNLSYDAWGTIVRGRNVYEGIYRGGKRAVDLYDRVHGGIAGAGMASYKTLKQDTMTAQNTGMSDADFEKYDPLWDIVNFLKAVQYRDLRGKLSVAPYDLKLPD